MPNLTTLALLVVGCIAYLVWPFDLIPDFLVGPGQIDDAAVIAWTVHKIKELKYDRTPQPERAVAGPEPQG